MALTANTLSSEPHHHRGGAGDGDGEDGATRGRNQPSNSRSSRSFRGSRGRRLRGRFGGETATTRSSRPRTLSHCRPGPHGGARWWGTSGEEGKHRAVRSEYNVVTSEFLFPKPYE